MTSLDAEKALLAQALREHKTWGDAYIAERARAERLTENIKDCNARSRALAETVVEERARAEKLEEALTRISRAHASAEHLQRIADEALAQGARD